MTIGPYGAISCGKSWRCRNNGDVFRVVQKGPGPTAGASSARKALTARQGIVEFLYGKGSTSALSPALTGFSLREH